MKKQVLGLGLWVVLGLMLACRLPFLNENVPLAEDAQEVGMDEGNGLAPSVSTPGTDCPITIENVTPPQALDPKSLHYVGAFRLPDDSGGLGWDYSGNGMTYTPHDDFHALWGHFLDQETCDLRIGLGCGNLCFHLLHGCLQCLR